MPQSLSRVFIHLIFSTKNRYPFLENEEIRAAMHAYLGGVVKTLGSEAVSIGGVTDHVHLLVVLPRTLTIADFMKELKRVSSLWAHENGMEKFHWQSGYGAFSVSQSNVDQVDAYIRNQVEHHKNVSFQDEYRLFLRKHAIPYKEEYLWD